MSKKSFKTLDEQIEILQNKGLTIEDVEETKSILLRENYFFISGYRHFFTKNDSFYPGTTFDELYSVFLFDRHIRNIIFKNILVVENNIKSIMSYQLSRKYGIKENDYLNIKNFTQDSLRVRQVNDIISKMKRQIRVNGKHHTATMHYINNYGYIPLWILVKVLSFGIMSELFNILKMEDQESIAGHYNVAPDTLSIYLAILANFRNLCAHEDILYDHKTQRRIPNTKYHNFLQIPVVDDEYIYGKNDLFAVIIILKEMLTEEEFRELMNEISYEIDILDGSITIVPTKEILNKIGFPDNFRDILDIR